MSSEQTEKATPKKRQKASDQGDRLVSRELLSSVALLAGTVVLGVVGSHWTALWRQGYQHSLDLAMPESSVLAEPVTAASALRAITLSVTYPMVFVGVMACMASLLLGLVQGGGQLKFAAIVPKWSRLSPATNIRHVFSQQAVVRLLKSSLPVAAIGWLAWEKLAAMATLPVLSLARLPSLFQAVYDLLLDTSLLMLAWSSVDFVSTWWSREKRLRMSKQDVKDESKESEGSPQIKRRIRSIQRQMRGRKLRTDVSKATVVVTNPTHYAVALSFDFQTMDPPKVLAKGRDLLAAEIREQARWAGIPLIENPSLARSLYRMVEPGQVIPFELYAAVAAILAYLYRSEVEQRMRKTEAPTTNPNSRGSYGVNAATRAAASWASRAPVAGYGDGDPYREAMDREVTDREARDRDAAGYAGRGTPDRSNAAPTKAPDKKQDGRTQPDRSISPGGSIRPKHA